MASIPSGPVLELWGASVPDPSGLGWCQQQVILVVATLHWGSPLLLSALVLGVQHSHCHSLASVPSQGRSSCSHHKSQSFPGWLCCPGAAPGVQFRVQKLPVGLDQGGMKFGGWQQPPVPPLPSGCSCQWCNPPVGGV